MGPKPNGKRPAPTVQVPSKRRKVAPRQLQSNTVAINRPKKLKETLKAADRGIIPIPSLRDHDDAELSEQDREVFEIYGGAVSFLDNLDHKGISRSKGETERLHRLNKPARQARQTGIDDLPSIESHDEDQDSWSSGFEDISLAGSDDEQNMPSDEDPELYSSQLDSDLEMPYEVAPRKRRPSWEPEEHRGIQRLPIKLADGRIRRVGNRYVGKQQTDEEREGEKEDLEQLERNGRQRVEDVSTGARFGRPAVIDIVGNKSRKVRIQGAKDQIAGICQEIVAEPENSLGLLRRLYTFSLTKISTPSHPDPITNDLIIRKLAVLSQLAVFKDIIPGYRIRPLTEKEKAEKVSQMVARTREWEQGLVVVYQSYLRSLETELKAQGEMADVALRCMCTLVTEVTHFNFRVNLISCIVGRLGKKSWDMLSNLCLDTLIQVFRADLTGTASLEVVRLLNRMIKEKRFNVHPEVLSCLLHLRLKTELNVRASESKTDQNDIVKRHSKGKGAARRAKGKATDQAHLSNKAKKILKEKKEIEREVREAEAEVDKEERAVTQTETLKLLFVLYFRILKSPNPTPLLPAALQGIAKFAHLVNIDFFKDLMKVLKHLISRDVKDGADWQTSGSPADVRGVQQRLLCIITAFELLSGQGDALNIDLSDFVSSLYAIILSLGFLPDIETSCSAVRPLKTQSVADMLFRALNTVFSPRTFGTAAPPWRSAAFAKRLLTVSLHWPPAVALRALDFVGGLLTKDPKLEALLSTEDRSVDGLYRPEIDDPQLCNPFGTSFWELFVLLQNHWDIRIRDAARQLASFTRS